MIDGMGFAFLFQGCVGRNVTMNTSAARPRPVLMAPFCLDPLVVRV